MRFLYRSSNGITTATKNLMSVLAALVLIGLVIGLTVMGVIPAPF